MTEAILAGMSIESKYAGCLLSKRKDLEYDIISAKESAKGSMQR